MPLGNWLSIGEGRIRTLTVLAASGLLLFCGGCGGAKTSATGTATATGTQAAVVHAPPNRQEIIKARKCLEREGVRPAKHKAYKAQIPRGTGEVTRGGLPVTPEEYESQVRRCVAPRQSARAKAVRSK
jgi:hypothetical protein